MEGCNVLLVDDEEEFASTLAERLSLRGIRVRVANNGEDALRNISEEIPEIVVLDLMMPGMNGMAVLGRIKASYPEVQVLLLTGMGSVEEGMEGLRLGAFDFLMKPLNLDELIQKVNDAMTKCPKRID